LITYRESTFDLSYPLLSEIFKAMAHDPESTVLGHATRRFQFGQVIPGHTAVTHSLTFIINVG
jgi:hypothetical protein